MSESHGKQRKLSAMPRSTSKESELAEGTLSVLSVLDFLYHDSRRIGSFLAQFEGDGHLQQMTRNKDGSRSKREISGKEFRGNVGIAAGKLQGSAETTVNMLEGYSQVFDPYWSNARAFLDYLSDHNMLKRDIENARIGQFVLVTGSLIVADMGMLQSLWSLPTIKQVIANAVNGSESENVTNNSNGNRQQRRSAGRQKPPEPAGSLDLQVTMEVLPHLPHSAHLHVVSNDFAVWAPAASDSLVTPTSDLVLKHGAKVAGQWSMLGILDAMPFDESELMTGMEMLRTGMLSNDNIAQAALNLAPIIKQAIGRPILSYGMTPLLVFREVV